MLTSTERIDLLVKLGEYMMSDDPEWAAVKAAAVRSNPWFTEASVNQASASIVQGFLQRASLQNWMSQYKPVAEPKNVGVVMAGNIPLVGFHDFLSGFVSGNNLRIKLSSKDDRLLPHLVRKLSEWNAEVNDQVSFADILKGSDAYIATGSNNTARYFEQYFGRYPSIIRKNRTSVAVLHGDENEEELSLLADDVFSYYGLGCRNVTQVCVPEGYDFSVLLAALAKYDELMLHHKYKNNYDYHLALYLLNRVPYLTNESVLMVENNVPFSAVAVLHYRYYSDRQTLLAELQASEDIQAVVGRDSLPFGSAQRPALTDYADGVDTMAFLSSL